MPTAYAGVVLGICTWGSQHAFEAQFRRSINRYVKTIFKRPINRYVKTIFKRPNEASNSGTPTIF
ncbi:hypothetical protein CR513_52403, partial [Mucuna pruriens]